MRKLTAHVESTVGLGGEGASEGAVLLGLDGSRAAQRLNHLHSLRLDQTQQDPIIGKQYESSG